MHDQESRGESLLGNYLPLERQFQPTTHSSDKWDKTDGSPYSDGYGGGWGIYNFGWAR